MKADNWIYLKFQELNSEIRIKNKLNPNTKNRLDCVSSCKTNNDLRGLTFFVNDKGQMFLYKSPARAISKTELKRQAVWMLTGKSINISSMYIDIPEYPQYAYGNPPHTQMLGVKEDKPNPLYAYRNDLYLFIINHEYAEIELIIIPDQKNLWNTYYFKLIQGEFDENIQNLRNNSKSFYDYGL